MNTELYICGDIHGELETLVFNLTEREKIHDSVIIIVGDFGVGFGRPQSMDVKYKKVRKRLENNNLKIYTIRGNHDNPEFFDGKHDYDRLQFLPDHLVTEVCGLKVYPIGGATSTDLGLGRKEDNDRFIKMGSRQRCWWPDEGIFVKESSLPVKVDLILTHTAPLAFQPVPIREDHIDYDTWQKILEERRYLDFVLDKVIAKYWFYGHYHTYMSGNIGDMLYRCLPPHDLFKVYIEQFNRGITE